MQDLLSVISWALPLFAGAAGYILRGAFQAGSLSTRFEGLEQRVRKLETEVTGASHKVDTLEAEVRASLKYIEESVERIFHNLERISERIDGVK